MSQATRPFSLDGFIRDFAQRDRAMHVVRALGIALGLVVAWLVAFGLVDRFVRLSPMRRGMLLAALGSMVMYLVARAIYRWRYRPIDPNLAAAEIERRDPQLAERLQTIISQRALPAHLRGSDSLLSHIEAEAVRELDQRPVARLLPWRELMPALWLVLVTGAIAIGLLAVPMLGWKTLVARQLAPWAKIAPVSTTILRVQPGDLDVPQGSQVTIRVQAEHLGSGRLTLRCGTDRRSLSAIAMAPGEEGGYQVQIDSVDQDLWYQVVGGDAESPVYRLRTLRRPVVREFRVKCDYPPYLGQKSMSFVSTDGHLEVPRGTQVQVAIVASEPLSDATATVAGVPIETASTVDPNVRTISIEVQQSSEWSIELKSDRNVTGAGPDGMTINSIEDRPPMIELMRTDLRLHPRDVLALPFQASDDYGIARIRTDVKKGDTILKTRQDVPASSQRLVQDVVSIDLAGAGLDFGDVVTIALTATDTAGQEKTSPPCRILLSPRSVDPRALRRVESLREALEFSELIDQHPDYAIDTQRAIMRAIPLTDDPATGDVLSVLVARTQQMITALAWSTQPDRLPANQRKNLEETVSSLRTLCQGESARILLADSENIRAMQNAGEKLSKPEQAAMKQSVERAQAEWSRAVEQMQLDPGSPQTMARLGELDRVLANLLKQASGWDATRCARQWQNKSADVREMRDCMSVASQVQVLRRDADYVWARDLQLAARAMIVIDESNRKDDGADRQAVGAAVETLAGTHRATSGPPLAAPDRIKLNQKAEAARETLRRLAGETQETIAQRSDWEQSLEEAAEMDEDLEQTSAAAQGPEQWHAPEKGDGKGDPRSASNGGSRELAQAREMGNVAKQQASLNQQSGQSADAANLSAGQKAVTRDIQQLVDQQKEDFFDKNQADNRANALQAIRDAQQKLAELPQQLVELRRQAQNVSSLRDTAHLAADEAAEATPERLPAAQRMAGLSAERASSARDELQKNASATSGGASSAAVAARQQLSAASVSLPSAGPQRLDNALQQLSADLTDSRLDAAAQSQARVLDAVASLQSSLRTAQKQLMERDPLVSAKYFAQQAGVALEATPPRMPEASEAQRRTSESLGMAWDAALARGMSDKMKSMPMFRSLLVDEFASSGTGTGGGASGGLSRGMSREWGRLSARETAGTFGAGPRESMAEGYEASIKAYFEALNKARGEIKK